MWVRSLRFECVCQSLARHGQPVCRPPRDHCWSVMFVISTCVDSCSLSLCSGHLVLCPFLVKGTYFGHLFGPSLLPMAFPCGSLYIGGLPSSFSQWELVPFGSFIIEIFSCLYLVHLYLSLSLTLLHGISALECIYLKRVPISTFSPKILQHFLLRFLEFFCVFWRNTNESEDFDQN